MSAEEDVEILEDVVENDKLPDSSKTRLPLSRIRNIMKLDPDLQAVTKEAVHLVCKATELFIAAMAREAYVHTQQAKKKTVQKKDIIAAVDCVDAFAFLEGTLDS